MDLSPWLLTLWSELVASPGGWGVLFPPHWLMNVPHLWSQSLLWWQLLPVWLVPLLTSRRSIKQHIVSFRLATCPQSPKCPSVHMCCFSDINSFLWQFHNLFLGCFYNNLQDTCNNICMFPDICISTSWYIGMPLCQDRSIWCTIFLAVWSSCNSYRG